VPIDSESAIGDLSVDERGTFSFTVSLDEAVSISTIQTNLSVHYRNPSSGRTAAKHLYPTFSIHPERDWLSVSSESTRFDVDTDNQLRVQVENIESQQLRDVTARLETSAPFESESTQSFIERLESGETETVTFGLTVSEDAVPTQSSVTLNISATRADGEEIHVDTYQVPISVEEDITTSDTTLFAIGALGAVIIFIAGWWWLRR
jgi:hypothetical protein